MSKNVLQKYFDGQNWVEIHPITKTSNVFDENGKNVSTIVNSINAQVNALSSKVIYFVFKDICQGVQAYECPFIYNGTIKSISAIYKSDSTEPIIIDIEKVDTSNRLSEGWASILSDKLTISNINNTQTYTVSDAVVNAGDVFRINILNNNINISSLTVNIEIMI